MKNPRKLLFAAWACENKFYASYQYWYTPLKKIFPNIISFDPQKNLGLYGRAEMNKKFLNIVKKEKPDYIFFWMIHNEFDIDTLSKIRETYPKTKTVCFWGDDDILFDIYSRYYSLFFDYYIAGNLLPSDFYKKNKIDALVTSSINLDDFKPLNLEKKYDVTLIGTLRKERYDIIKYLLDKGIDVRVFGWGWHQHPELKKIYGGPLSNKEFVKKMNQTRINLCTMETAFGRVNQLKSRILEIGACKSFLLAEYSPTLLNLFKEGRELAVFRDKKDLLKKVKYYLQHEKEREKIAENMYKKTIKEYDVHKDLKKFFKKVFKEEKNFLHKSLPKINKKITLLEEKDLKLSLGELKEKLKDTDYIYFFNGNAKFSPHKNYFQAYSLEKSGKPISCCDYYVYSKNIGNYLILRSKFALMLLNKNEFYSLLDINQLMTTKEYFLKNIDTFKKIFEGHKIDIINDKNTAFIYIPLVQINNSKTIDYESMKKVFFMTFRERLENLFYQKKLLSSSYPYKLLLEGLFKDPFILKYLCELIFNKNKLHAFKKIF